MGKNNLQYLCRVGDIPDGTLQCFRIGEERSIVVIRRGEQFLACENRCPHAGAPLDDALLRGDILTCVWHGWQFHLPDGCSLEKDDNAALTMLRLHQQNGKLYLDESEQR